MEGRGLLGNKYHPWHPSKPRRRQNYVSQVSPSLMSSFTQYTYLPNQALWSPYRWLAKLHNSRFAGLHSRCGLTIFLFDGLFEIGCTHRHSPICKSERYLAVKELISRTTLRVKELQQFLKSIGIGGVPTRSSSASPTDEKGSNEECLNSLLDLADYQVFWMR